MIEIVLRMVLLHFSASPKRSLHYLDLSLTRWFYKYFHSTLIVCFYLALWDGWHLFFALAEVQALDMKSSWDEVDEEKANNSSIDVDDIIDIYFKEADDKADNNHEYKVANFPDIHFLFLGLWHAKYSEYSFPESKYNYLLMSINSGNTE